MSRLTQSVLGTVGIVAAILAGAANAWADPPQGSLTAWGDSYTHGVVEGIPVGNDFVAVAGGSSWAVALRSDGTLASWGNDIDGTTSHMAVSGTPTGGGFAAVAAGVGHGVALRLDGTLVSWGDDNGGRITGAPGGNDFIAVAAGSYHCVALRSDGTLVSWGDDSSGVVSDTPAGSGFVAVAAGLAHGVALRSDGSLLSWGDDSFGQVSATPAGQFVAVAAASHHSVAIRADGSLVTWAGGEFAPRDWVPTEGAFTRVATASYHSIALRSDGSLATWGNDGGQWPPAGTGFIAVAAGGDPSAGGYTGGADFNLAILAVAPPPAADQIAALDDAVEALVAGGALTPLRALALRVFLHYSGYFAERGHERVAIGLLEAFVGQVNKYVRNGRLAAAAGGALVEGAASAIESLGS